MLDRWQVVRTAAGSFGKPGELADLWSDDLVLDGAAPVATLAAVDDDHDWWHRSAVTADEPVVVDFGGLSFPATVFVDGREAAECTSMFLPVRVSVVRCSAGIASPQIRASNGLGRVMSVASTT